MATRSPACTPRPCNAPTSRRHRCAISPYVSDTEPQTTAVRSAATCVARRRGEIIVAMALLLRSRVGATLHQHEVVAVDRLVGRPRQHLAHLRALPPHDLPELRRRVVHDALADDRRPLRDV